MSEYVIYHIVFDKNKNNQSYTDAIASYTDFVEFFHAMEQIGNMVCSIRDRYMKEGNIDELIKNPPIVNYSYFGYEDIGCNDMNDNGNLLGKVKSVSVNINGVDHTYKGMIV